MMCARPHEIEVAAPRLPSIAPQQPSRCLCECAFRCALHARRSVSTSNSPPSDRSPRPATTPSSPLSSPTSSPPWRPPSCPPSCSPFRSTVCAPCPSPPRPFGAAKSACVACAACELSAAARPMPKRASVAAPMSLAASPGLQRTKSQNWAKARLWEGGEGGCRVDEKGDGRV
eukprot:4088663-Pleurochrysis_carterae.AAC.4